MPYHPTGRAPGRPKTKDYVTLVARVPAELVALVKQYARTHDQPVAELIRDGLVWRIGDGDPRGAGVYLDGRAGDEAPSLADLADVPLLLHDVRALLARQEAQIAALAQALAHQRKRVRPDVSYMNTTPMPLPAAVVSDEEHPGREDGPPQGLAQAPRAVHGEGTAYDPTKFYLGTLCPKGHDWGGTGQSLLRKHNQRCRACENAGKKARRQATRQAQALAGKGSL